MKIVEGIAKVLAFRTTPTTTVIVLLYLSVFLSVFYTDGPRNIPKDKNGLSLERGYADLHHIAARPHPYNSHANDIVRLYILDRVRNIAANYNHVSVDDDLVSNGSWVSREEAVYFEGTNVLVKIDGTDNEDGTAGGVLFSAHYDSVSTASGATDDGMGVATAIQLIEYLAANRPKRTAVFNINNGEEDWLNGAHAFLQHPWSNLTEIFLNLEGAASGGRPLLFRATSTSALYSFLGSNVPHPHGNVLSSDGFKRGLVRSGTDYSVYTDFGMQGLDLAFYKGRSKYHTKYDAIPYTDGEEKSLWSMMEAARGAGLALVNKDYTHEEGEPAVYFDLFSEVLVVLPLSRLLTFNILSIFIGPFILVLLLVWETSAQQSRRQRQNGSPPGSSGNILGRLWTYLKEFRWTGGFWRWAKFWVALLVTIGLQVALVVGYINLNPLIVYSSPYLVLISCMSLAYVTLKLVLALPISRVSHKIAVPEQQKHTVMLQTYLLTWILLLLSTVAIRTAGVGGLYFITAWNFVVFIGCCLGCFEGILGAAGTYTRIHGGVRYESLPAQAETTQTRVEDMEAREPTETTPLIQEGGRILSESTPATGREESGAIAWWLIQAIVVVPVAVILVLHIALFVLDGMPQTLADGNSPVLIYAAISLLSFLMVIPSAPFSFKIHRIVTYLVILVFAASTAYTWVSFPFDQEAPLKIFFQQTISLEGSDVSRVTTSLSGVSAYLQSRIVSKIPSSAGKNVSCVPNVKSRAGLDRCSWETALLPSPGGNESAFPTGDRWFTSNATRLGDSTARITVKGTNTRNCRLYFDNQAIVRYTVFDENMKSNVSTMQPGYEIGADGVNEIRLWSRTWDRNFTVDVEWRGDSAVEHLEGRVACEWVEYESGTVGISTGGKIPAYEEVLTWLPKWVVATKYGDGLVEVARKFSI